ncbi:MAG: EscV/YscV/HrcV family type III secretion system export apparatus protein [Gammaproteobacteria bacterium]|nr:EscV/YscV/HrcV family type III secretion system export apparatus protein [Gammaproteobacteria bacterium]
MLACLVVAVIFMMVIPLPTTLLDGLIAINIMTGMLLLMVAMYIPTPLAFSSFPAVLLITTLFRLAISISTTRLILLNADAGEIIFAFGNFVVQGNFIVGAVIFLIITIVQFMVITKGAERVAEVSARFSLDAMPGKQMSIDGDMRAGVIDLDEARRRRGNVEKESQLFGSMDGAMKFVKGDAVAGLIITAVNIVGGITIGTTQHGMSAAEAVSVYSILTIGDGLVSQIPGLLIAITSGVIVTRVTTEESTNLGADISRQLLGQPKALMIAGSMMFLFGIVPGFPTPVFFTLGLILLVTGYLLNQMSKTQAEAGEEGSVPAMAAAGETGKQAAQRRIGHEDEFSMTVPLMIDIDADVETAISANKLNEELIKIRRALYLDLGVPFPGIHLRFTSGLQNGEYQLLIQETPMATGFVKPDHVFCREQTNQLDVIGIPYEEGDKFLPGSPTIWVAETHAAKMKAAGVPFLDSSQVLTYHLSFVLTRFAADFIGIQETRFLLTRMEDRFGELVKEVQRVVPIQKITEVLQRLVSEEISIRDLRTINQALVEWGQKEKDTVLLCEYIRGSLRRYISYKYSNGHNMLPAYILTPDAEELIRNGVRQTSAGSYLALDPRVTQKFIQEVKATVGDLSKSRQKPVIVVSMDIRRYVRKLIEKELYELPVLSYQELTQEITVQPLDQISV